MINNKGEYILMVNGEIHLERCVWDLEKDFFRDKVQIGDIIVDFKETISS